jgi:ATP-dependent DNA ligase
MKYTEYRYIYPPRPEKTTHFSELDKYDNGTFIAQPKYNGTCCVVFINTAQQRIMNRHNGVITSDYNNIDFKSLYEDSGCKGWLVLAGEFLNKNKKGEDGNPFNLKFIIFDILVYDSDYLIGTKLSERLDILNNMIPETSTLILKDRMSSFAHLNVSKYNNIFKAPSYYGNFKDVYESIVDTDLYEGLVLKRKDSKLGLGFSEKNNSDWQIKCRKPTKLYDF